MCISLFAGTKPLSKRLKKGAIPSKNLPKSDPAPSQLSQARQLRYSNRCTNKVECGSQDVTIVDALDLDVAAQEEIMDTSEHPNSADPIEEVATTSTRTSTTSNTVDTQTPVWADFSLDKFRHDPESIRSYTGLEDYKKVIFVLQTLGEAAYHLNYFYTQVEQISVEDQFFMVLIKMRQKKTNFELARLFGTSTFTVTNVFITWVNFMYAQWKELEIWPSRDLVRFYAPSDFKLKFPSTRAMVDGTEIPIEKPKNPTAQQQTFSTYKNRNTAKVLVSATPAGLISHITDSYGGSTSDRQIVERSNLTTICDPKDSLMADKGFNVQDIFAPYDVHINIPEFFLNKNRMSGESVQKDRKIASKRVHIERLIGLGKTYSILVRPMNSTETKLSTKIIFICYMLCNFRKAIVSKTA